MLLDNLTTAVLHLDPALVVVRLNPAGELLFGLSERHCRNRPVAEALPGLAPQLRRLQRAQTERAGYTEREMLLQGRHGAPVLADCTVTPFADEGGHPALLLEFAARDRQRRISRDASMRTRNVANREMLRGLAHEIKNPLGGLRGAAQLLERELDDPGQREYTAVIVRETERLRSLVDNMLGPRRPPSWQSLNLHEPLEHVRMLITTDLPREVSVVRDYDPSLPAVSCDREQLVQVFFNLMGNAAAALTAGGHGGEPGRITLRSRAQRRFTIGGIQHRLVVRIDVIDNGAGIAAELLPHIFHPMVSARAGGTGLGLPIAQDLLELNGGLLECNSRPGHTAFSVFLPLTEDNSRGRT